jgi:hypothetical protein
MVNTGQSSIMEISKYWPEKIDFKKDAEILFCQRRPLSHFHAKLYLLVGLKLSQRGFPVSYMFHDPLLAQIVPCATGKGFPIKGALFEHRPKMITSRIITPDGLKHRVDLEFGVAFIENINFFPEILSGMRSLQKRYNIDFTNNRTLVTAKDLLYSSMIIYSYFKLLEDYALKTKKKVFICGWESLYPPGAIFKKLCDQAYSYSDHIQYIDLNRGYMHYFHDFPVNSNFIAFANLTRTGFTGRLGIPGSTLGEIADPESALADGKKYMVSALSKHTNHPDSPEKQNTLALIHHFKQKGRRVFALFSHLFYDTPVNDTSPAFSDMCEWLVETAKWFSETDDLLLLKPHPAELRSRTNQTETLSDFVTEYITSTNIHLLHHNEFSIRELADHISGGLIWRSSVAMELTFLNIPCVIAGVPSYGTLPLDYASSSENYFEQICAIGKTKVSQKQINATLKYLFCLRNKHHEIPQIVKDDWFFPRLKTTLEGVDESFEQMIGQMIAECF